MQAKQFSFKDILPKILNVVKSILSNYVQKNVKDNNYINNGFKSHNCQWLKCIM